MSAVASTPSFGSDTLRGIGILKEEAEIVPYKVRHLAAGGGGAVSEMADVDGGSSRLGDERKDEKKDDDDGRARTCVMNTCGLPGAGKSTLCRALMAHLRRTRDRAVRVSLVSFDDIERQLYREKQRRTCDGVAWGRMDDTTYDAAVWKAARREAFARLDALLRSAPIDDGDKHRKHLVIADDNFYYTSMRFRVHQLARRVAAAHVQLFVDVDATLAHERNETREGAERVPRDALERMAAALEAPTPPERQRPFERGRTAVVGPAGDDVAAAAAAAWEQVYALWGSPPPMPDTEEEREAQRLEGSAANAKSAVHALDIRSRRALSECMSSPGLAAAADPAEKGRASRELNAARKAMLDAVRDAGRAATAARGSREAGEDDEDEAALAFDATLVEQEAAFVHLCRRVAAGGPPPK